MIVYADGKVFNFSSGTIAVVLTDQDKKNIKDMAPQCDTYALLDDGMTPSGVRDTLIKIKRMTRGDVTPHS